MQDSASVALPQESAELWPSHLHVRPPTAMPQGLMQPCHPLTFVGGLCAPYEQGLRVSGLSSLSTTTPTPTRGSVG